MEECIVSVWWHIKTYCKLYSSVSFSLNGCLVLATLMHHAPSDKCLAFSIYIHIARKSIFNMAVTAFGKEGVSTHVSIHTRTRTHTHTHTHLATSPHHHTTLPPGHTTVMQCWRCKAYGHRTGDRECPLSKSGNIVLDAERQVDFDVTKLLAWKCTSYLLLFIFSINKNLSGANAWSRLTKMCALYRSWQKIVAKWCCSGSRGSYGAFPCETTACFFYMMAMVMLTRDISGSLSLTIARARSLAIPLSLSLALSSRRSLAISFSHTQSFSVAITLWRTQSPHEPATRGGWLGG